LREARQGKAKFIAAKQVDRCWPDAFPSGTYCMSFQVSLNLSCFLSIAAAAVLEGEQDEVAAERGSFMKPLQPHS